MGDSPIIGASTYADNATAAISATGRGELFMRHVVAHEIAATMRHGGSTLREAATTLIRETLYRKGLRGGVVAVDAEGRVALPFNTEGMVRGTTTERVPPSVELL